MLSFIYKHRAILYGVLASCIWLFVCKVPWQWALFSGGAMWWVMDMDIRMRRLENRVGELKQAARDAYAHINNHNGAEQ